MLLNHKFIQITQWTRFSAQDPESSSWLKLWNKSTLVSVKCDSYVKYKHKQKEAVDLLWDSLVCLLTRSVKMSNHDDLLMLLRHTLHLKCDSWWMFNLYSTLGRPGPGNVVMNFSWIVRYEVNFRLPEFCSNLYLLIITVPLSNVLRTVYFAQCKSPLLPHCPNLHQAWS